VDEILSHQNVALLLCSIYASFMGRKSKAEEPAVFSRLEEWRVARGLSRQELADAVSVHYQTIGYLERGEYSPSLALALHIASVLDVPLEELFSLQPFTKSRKGV
jgi:DNA-binding XRE family transcriptional regulator